MTIDQIKVVAVVGDAPNRIYPSHTHSITHSGRAPLTPGGPSGLPLAGYSPRSLGYHDHFHNSECPATLPRLTAVATESTGTRLRNAIAN